MAACGSFSTRPATAGDGVRTVRTNKKARGKMPPGLWESSVSVELHQQIMMSGRGHLGAGAQNARQQQHAQLVTSTMTTRTFLLESAAHCQFSANSSGLAVSTVEDSVWSPDDNAKQRDMLIPRAILPISGGMLVATA